MIGLILLAFHWFTWKGWGLKLYCSQPPEAIEKEREKTRESNGTDGPSEEHLLLI